MIYGKYIIYVLLSDEEKLDSDVLKNKLVFSTFHQAKGLERKFVTICSNEFYVAVTQASERLILLHDIKHNFLNF